MADRIVDPVRVRDLRESQHLTKEALALAANVSLRTVYYLEAKRRPISGIVLHKIAQALGVPVSALLVQEPNGAAA